MLKRFVAKLVFKAAVVSLAAWAVEKAGELDGSGQEKPKKLHRRKANRQARRLRNNLSHRQVDEMIDDSFPASDPPSTY